MLGNLTALMDFSDKTMASPGSAYLGEVPGMLMNSIYAGKQRRKKRRKKR